MEPIESILQSARKLPPFPAVIEKVMQLIHDSRTSARDVVEVIRYDQSITAHVLRVCNSAYFGLRRPVHSLQEAVLLIGFDQLLRIVLSGAVSRQFSQTCQGYELDQGSLWRHSVGCAVLSQIISKRLGREGTALLFTAGLLHDIGKLVLSHFVRDQFREIMDRVTVGKCSFIEAEQEVLGIDHAELGGLISERWQFPKEIVAAIRYHHRPLSAEDRKEVDIIYLSDLVAMLTGVGGGADGLSYRAHGEVMKAYNLRERDIEAFISEWMSQMQDQFEIVNRMLDLNGTGQEERAGTSQGLRSR